MAAQYDEITEPLRAFIGRQRMFFVATAATDGRVNLSPKGQDSLRVTGPNEVLWMNLTGSGNETAAHLLENDRMTLMWCAFEGAPMILRVYGTARAAHPRDAEWAACAAELPSRPGARQYFRVAVDLVQTSCGYAVPETAFVAERTVLDEWTGRRGADGVKAYWRSDNARSLDGRPTGIGG